MVWARSFTRWILYNRDWSVVLKTLDPIGNCQRPVFSLGVSHHMHNITNLRTKFELNILVIEVAKCLIMGEKYPWQPKLCAFRCLISRPKSLILSSPNQIRGKLLLSLSNKLVLLRTLFNQKSLKTSNEFIFWFLSNISNKTSKIQLELQMACF